MATIYGLAFRMVAERRVLQDAQLRDWIAADRAVSGDAVARLVQAMQASRLFRREVERDVLGKEQPVTGFRHELIGKFLAARHVRRMIGQGADSATVDYISLSGDELWLDMFYFVIDEIDSSPVLNRFLQEILATGGPARMRITAYAIETRRAEVGSKVLMAYEKAKLDEDLALTAGSRASLPARDLSQSEVCGTFVQGSRTHNGPKLCSIFFLHGRPDCKLVADRNCRRLATAFNAQIIGNVCHLSFHPQTRFSRPGQRPMPLTPP